MHAALATEASLSPRTVVLVVVVVVAKQRENIVARALELSPVSLFLSRRSGEGRTEERGGRAAKVPRSPVVRGKSKALRERHSEARLMAPGAVIVPVSLARPCAPAIVILYSLMPLQAGPAIDRAHIR